MITEANFKELLLLLHFREISSNVYEKLFPQCDEPLCVDLAEKKLLYPSKIKGRERNNDFSANENFVVFECVHRLLEKGYRAEHIELEKEWHLGHDAKSGRADICVSDDDGNMLFIIECKTWGKEFEKAFKDTKADGAQLFSYWQQEQSCKWLILYTSDLKNNTIEHKAPTINCSDDPNIELLAKKDKSVKLYHDARTVPEKVEVWEETYSSVIYDDLIFPDDSVAYQIGIKPLYKKDLKDFTPEDKIVNKFEEILRHNNISDKENAFNRLIALFVCKLVDEITKDENDIVDFQYKQGTDTYETLQDRLQQLHRDGMEKFMKEKIAYIPSDYPERLFSTYTGSRRKKAIEDLKNTIRILKFYSNNDFAFKDVHNEELFYQNGKVLVEVVQLFERYRIVYPSKHQFLGDLFEQLLNKGFKQNEGQFFTPMPITRFIWDCLPVKQMVHSEKGTAYPKVIDYACGAGHFLTEGIEAINYFAENAGNNSWVRECIYGIEKDYRLARVSKVSLFMNGAGDGNIIFGDGLENAPDKGIENGKFDILVANPPYSVKYFKQHLQLKNNNFVTLDYIGTNGSEIETLFAERIAQLLKPRGVAAVILPVSLLTNDSGSYTCAREQLLKNFYFRGIVAFGSKTFGATGTNTVVLFLEKFNEPPRKTTLIEDSVNAIMSVADLTGWEDDDIFNAYLAQIGVSEDDYKAFLKKAPLADINAIGYFKMYAQAFDDSSDAKSLKQTRAYKNMTPQEQDAEYLERFYAYAGAIEKEKLFYFALLYKQKTVIITAPADNKAQKDFLGYDWSNRKGNEGIQIIKPGGKMYDDADRQSETALAAAIRNSFSQISAGFSEEQGAYARIVNTKDVLDFSRESFNKAIRLSAKKAVLLTSKYPIAQLGNIADVIAGQSPESIYYNSDKNGLPFFQGKKDYGTKFLLTPTVWTSYTTKESLKGDILMSVRAPVGDININPYDKICIGRGLSVIRSNTQDVLQDYLYYFFKFNQLNITGHKGLGFDSISIGEIKELKVPVPPVSIQQKIIDECSKINDGTEGIQTKIESYKKEIEHRFAMLDDLSINGKRFRLNEIDKFDVNIGKRVKTTQFIEGATVPVYSANVKEPFGYLDVTLFDDFSLPSVLWGIDGDWMTSFIPENSKFYPTDHCGVLRCKTAEVNPRYLAHILEREGKAMGFSRAHRASIERVEGISFTVADRETQDKYISAVTELESQIAEAQNTLMSLQGETAKIIRRYLGQS